METRKLKARIITISIFTLTMITTLITGFRILDIGRKDELHVQRKARAQKLEASLYDISSLERTISKLEIEVMEKSEIYGDAREYLKMTEDVLLLFKKNKIKIISYSIEGEEYKEELVLNGVGSMERLLHLFYDLSFPEPGFSIRSFYVDTKSPEKPATLTMRVSNG